MAKKAEIPCASCRSWVKKQKKFSCNPDECSGLTEWMFANAPHISGGENGNVKLLVRLPMIATQYVV
jgi:hypothetical protein